jgi:hypothetical protein
VIFNTPSETAREFDGTALAEGEDMDFQDLYRIGSAASDVGVHDWLRRFIVSGALLAFVITLWKKGSRWALALLMMTGLARAEEHPDDEVVARLHFIETRLKAETVQAHAWEYGWGVVDVFGAGYGAYQVAQSSNRAELTEGIVGVVKSVGGVAGIALAPLKTARGTHELDDVPDTTPDERLKRLVIAESLLRRNAHEADIRYSWKPHVISALLNIAGGVIIGVVGDWAKGAQSAGIGLAVGELQIWTRPWQAKRDLREYRRAFGGLAGSDVPRLSSAVRVSPAGLAVTF